MLDKLHLNSRHQLDFEFAAEILKGRYSQIVKTATKFHEEVCVFKYGPERGRKSKTLLALHLGPRHSSILPVKLELNPSHFESFSELQSILLSMIPISELKIQRLDYAVDLPDITVNQVSEALTLTRKKKREAFTNHVMTGFTIGGPPEIVCCYSKDIRDDHDGILTRIELRHFQDKVPFRSFQDLPKYKNFEPFNSLKLQKPKSEIGLSSKDRFKVQLFAQGLSIHGAQQLAKICNLHGNYKRDFGHLLEPDPKFPNLNEIYQQNMNSFFREESP